MKKINTGEPTHLYEVQLQRNNDVRAIPIYTIEEVEIEVVSARENITQQIILNEDEIYQLLKQLKIMGIEV